jgi:multicomponent Na+:H+ antiporter subunit E
VVLIRRVTRLALMLALLWIVLTGGTVGSWLVGVVAIALGSWVFVVLNPPAFNAEGPRYGFRWSALPPFLAHFLGRSAAAGVDVARRTLARRLDLAPEIITLPTVLPAGAPRLLLAATLSLVPGSLSVELEGDSIVLHVLDRHRDTALAVRGTEQHIARLFPVSVQRA